MEKFWPPEQEVVLETQPPELYPSQALAINRRSVPSTVRKKHCINPLNCSWVKLKEERGSFLKAGGLVLSSEELRELSFSILAHGIWGKRHLSLSYFHLSKHNQSDVTDH